jgi:hypothetical protein
MTGRELFEIWAPSDSIWSQWAAPALFAQIDCVAENEAREERHPVWFEHAASSDHAVIIDLPGNQAFRLAAVLAEKGYRPVPVINASPAPTPLRLNAEPRPESMPLQAIVTVDMTSLAWELCVATKRLKGVALPAAAPPAFILDALRLTGTRPVRDDMFDNRWMVFPQDFPSARFLLEHNIKRVTLVQVVSAQPSEDLAHVLLRWQEAGIQIFASAVEDMHHARLAVSRPSRFKASWYRALAILGLTRSSVGGFGSFLPTSAGG